MNKALKQAIECLFEICAPCDTNKSDEESISIEKEQLKTEFVNFISYLSSSDGIIATFETDFLKTYFDVIITPDELREHIDKNNTYTSDFEKKVPKTLIRLVERDNEIFNANKKLDVSYSLTFCKIFESVAKEFLVCDGDSTDEEISDMTTYITMLNNYRNSNCYETDNLSTIIDIESIHAGECVPVIDENGEIEKSLDELLNELNNLIGLDAVKKDVNSLIHLQEIKRLRKSRGLKDIPVSNHLVFYGNPAQEKQRWQDCLRKFIMLWEFYLLGHLLR